MARARNIKPGFFANESLAECGPWARLCFAGLWTLADKEGRLEDRPKRIKGELFRFDSVEVEPLLDELEQHGFLVRYTNSDGRFIQILAFKKHQTPHYTEKESVIKPPPLQEICGSMSGTDSESTPGDDPPSRPPCYPLNPDSLNPDSLNPDSLNPEEEGAALLRIVPPPPPSAFDGNNAGQLNGKALAALATTWELPEAWGVDAEALGWKPTEVLHEAERFRQYWVTGKGAGTRRSVKGWRQSWSNWLGKAERMQR
jgi:hypothetical protein